jgi:hypothetical protein
MSTDNAYPPRREVLGQLATAAVTLAGAACAPAAMSHAAAAPAPTPAADGAATTTPAPATPRKWDDAWATRLTAKHRAVFDAPDVADGTALFNAYVYMRSFGEVYGAPDSDIQAVLVARHRAVPLMLGDATWERYELGKVVRLRDEKTGKWARRNPFAVVDATDASAMPGLSLGALHERGALLLVCNLALGNLAGRLAAKTKRDRASVRAELRSALLPGVEIVPSGVFAVMRAQEAGCTYMRST